MEKLKKIGKFLAVYEVLGGIVGLVILGASVFGTGHPNRVGLALLVLPLLSLGAGVLLFRGKAFGRSLSFLVQLLQVPHLMLKGFYFFGFLLASLPVVRDSHGEFLLKWFVGAGAYFRVGDIPFQMAGVNLIALALILFVVPKAFEERV